jgi:lipid A 4'-phosphatase
VSRGWLLSSIVLGLVLGALFAAYPLWDLQVADWFFDHEAAKFPLAINYQWNVVRRVANWVPFLLMLPAVFALLRKLVFPSAPMMIAPSVVLFLFAFLPDRTWAD